MIDAEQIATWDMDGEQIRQLGEYWRNHEPPLTREQQIALMEGAAERREQLQARITAVYAAERARERQLAHEGTPTTPDNETATSGPENEADA